MQDGQRIALRRSNGDFIAPHQKFSTQELAERAADLSPNALLRPVVQDYLLPTAAYIGGPAELAYLAQSQVLYGKLLDRQPAAFPRACFTLLDERSHKRMVRYGVESDGSVRGRAGASRHDRGAAGAGATARAAGSRRRPRFRARWTR